ncbi:MAG: indolepyruvate oxidoreductase subunit beta [Eubacteriales bacterium]|nr:indolepyruvate oxidoreductase subunit beta [Eubacteriales bacterium]
MSYNYLLCGVGGQGTVLAAKVLAQTAINMGNEVKTTETIGMAQRGGSVVSHVRVGKNIHSPLLPMHSADMIIGFEPSEVVRNLAYLKEDGVVVVNKKAVKPTTSSLSGSDYDGHEMLEYLKKCVKTLVIVDGDKICEECGSPKVLNVALLGAAAGTGHLSAGETELTEALLSKVKEQFKEMNLKALKLGMESR